MADFAQAYPSKVFPDAVGVPDEGRENLLAYGTMVFNAFGPRNEILERSESPVQTFFRTTTREVEVDGVTVPEGEKVLLFLAAANRDRRRWEDPERFDISRKAGGHFAFGSGIHACVGRMVARLEGELLLGALARRVSAIELDGEPERMLNNTLRGLTRLPIRLRPG